MKIHEQTAITLKSMSDLNKLIGSKVDDGDYYIVIHSHYKEPRCSVVNSDDCLVFEENQTPVFTMCSNPKRTDDNNIDETIVKEKQAWLKRKLNQDLGEE